jgi:two-component sensor histidine kinase
MESLWKKISYVGIKSNTVLPHKELKKLVFFNQVLFVGILGTLLQVLMIWPIVGVKATVFAVVPLVSLASLLLNKKGKFKFSRILFIYTVYGLGLVTVLMLGGSGLYHLGVFSTFTFGLILFDVKTEKLGILFGVLITLFILAIGELELFNTPDYSQHFITPYFRMANIFSLITINSILTIFILQLNKKTEGELSLANSEKESALNQLTAKKQELEGQKDGLEKMVIKRTFEISSQKDTLEIQNKEKEVLLQEVHHRVKNNLQIIISLINLQLSKISSSEASDALHEIQARVQSMSLVHRKMYETNNFTEIKLKSYCDQLMENIQLLYSESPMIFENTIPENIVIDMDKAIPVGLILNEIVINFYKHAYDASKSDNKLSISIVSQTEAYIQLKCQDNGPGFPIDFDPAKESSLGLEIIEGLTGQIDGEVSFFNEEGAVYTFTVKI